MAMKMKKYEELELRDDFMFSRIMSNPKFVKPLLETILGVKIRKIVYPQTQKTIDQSLQAKGFGWMYMWRMIRTRYSIWKCRRPMAQTCLRGCVITRG